MNITDNISSVVLENYTSPPSLTEPIVPNPTITSIMGKVGIYTQRGFDIAKDWTQQHVAYDTVFLVALIGLLVGLIWLLRKLTR